jgi:hypothetical protein
MRSVSTRVGAEQRLVGHHQLQLERRRFGGFVGTGDAFDEGVAHDVGDAAVVAVGAFGAGVVVECLVAGFGLFGGQMAVAESGGGTSRTSSPIRLVTWVEEVHAEVAHAVHHRVRMQVVARHGCSGTVSWPVEPRWGSGFGVRRDR